MPTSDPTRIVPYQSAAAVVPDDAGAFGCTRALYVGGAGNLRVLTAGGEDVTFVGVLAGTVYPVNVTRVWATNTTATDILALR